MPRPLKVFKTHIGFFDLVVAAPSQKAAAHAWHASPRLFAQGFARITKDREAVEAALAVPGQVLKRPHGRQTPYRAEPDAPAAPSMTARQKQKAASDHKARKRREDAEKRAREAATKAAARAELAELAREEAALQRRRRELKEHLQASR